MEMLIMSNKRQCFCKNACGPSGSLTIADLEERKINSSCFYEHEKRCLNKSLITARKSSVVKYHRGTIGTIVRLQFQARHYETDYRQGVNRGPRNSDGIEWNELSIVGAKSQCVLEKKTMQKRYRNDENGSVGDVKSVFSCLP